MSNIDTARTRLKAAFTHLENALENKLSLLERANLNLSEEITTLKEKIQTLTNRVQEPALIKIENKSSQADLSLQFDSRLISKQASKQIDLSLSELKKLVK